MIKGVGRIPRTSRFHRSTLIPISQLPPEFLVLIFSFFAPFACDEEVGYLQLLRITHVCRQWRETALNYPHLWSYIYFTKLTPAGMPGGYQVFFPAFQVPSFAACHEGLDEISFHHL